MNGRPPAVRRAQRMVGTVARVKKLAKRKCEWCGKPLHALRTSKRFCSSRCTTAA